MNSFELQFTQMLDERDFMVDSSVNLGPLKEVHLHKYLSIYMFSLHIFLRLKFWLCSQIPIPSPRTVGIGLLSSSILGEVPCVSQDIEVNCTFHMF